VFNINILEAILVRSKIQSGKAGTIIVLNIHKMSMPRIFRVLGISSPNVKTTAQLANRSLSRA